MFSDWMHETARCFGYPSDSTRTARERAREATCGHHLCRTGPVRPGPGLLHAQIQAASIPAPVAHLFAASRHAPVAQLIAASIPAPAAQLFAASPHAPVAQLFAASPLAPVAQLLAARPLAPVAQLWPAGTAH